MMPPPAGKRLETHPPPGAGKPPVLLEAEDARTLAALYDRHAGAMYSLAMRVTGEPSDAAAIVRGVFAAVWSEAARRSGGHAPNVHRLLSTTRIRAIDHVRARGASAAAGPSVAGADDASTSTQAIDVATLHIPDPVVGGNTGDSDSEDAPRLRAAFRGLPPLERLAVDLAYFEGLTISQIAARLEQPPDAANARIRTALRQLAGSTAPPRSSEARRPGEPRRDPPPTRDLAALYALGALSARERAAFDAHLEVHRESVDEVMSLLPAARRLAWTVPPHEPPSGLRERVVETVTGAPLPDTAEQPAPQSSRPRDAGDRPEPLPEDSRDTVDDGDRPEPANDTDGSERGAEDGSTRPVRPDGGGESADAGRGAATTNHGNRAGPADVGGKRSAGVHDPPPAVDAAAPSPLIPPTEETTDPVRQPTPNLQKATPGMQQPIPTDQKRSRPWGLLSLAAGSLVVAAGLGLFAARQANLAAALQENLDAANTQARIAEMETAAAQRTVGEHREGARVLTADDVQMLDLAGQPAAPAARGRLFWSAGEGGLVAVTGLPAAPPGRIYQLWLIPDTTPMSAALLSADAEGRAMATVTPPEGVTAPVAAAVTLEPAGGATTPGGDVYLLGRP